MISKLAIIGLGHQTQTELLPAILTLQDRVSISAICDVSEKFIESSKLLIPQKDSVSTFTDYATLLSEVEAGKLSIDGVVISVPHYLYAEIVEGFLKAGIPVFKEKPLAHDVWQAKKIVRQSMRNLTQVYTVTKRQFYPAYQRGLELLRTGELGIPYMYAARHFIPHGNLYQGWRSSFETAGGGVFLDMGYHLLDVILRYFGDVSKSSLFGTNTAKPEFSYEVEDAASIQFWHVHGVHGVFQVGALTGPKEESIEVRGTRGRMYITKQSVQFYDPDNSLKIDESYSADGVVATAKALQEFLADDPQIWTNNIIHNLKLMKIVHSAYQGRTV